MLPEDKSTARLTIMEAHRKRLAGSWKVEFHRSFLTSLIIPTSIVMSLPVAGSTPKRALQSLPTEIMCHILSELDFETLLSFIRTRRRFYRLFLANWTYILPRILKSEFSPVEGIFRIIDDNLTSLAMCPPKLLGTAGFLSRLIQICHAVQKWEAIFPALRFSHQSGAASRILGVDENDRLRRALYTWWRFSNHFHGDNLPSPNVRFSFLRMLSTAELYELDDLWRTVQAAVEEKISPSVERVRLILGHDCLLEEAAKIGWGHGEENQRIARTIVKLNPSDMLHFLFRRHTYATKMSLVREIRLRHPSIEDNTEVLSWALQAVIAERFRVLAQQKGERAISRRRYFPADLGFPRCSGGILDYPAVRWEKIRIKFSDDGSDIIANREIHRLQIYMHDRVSRGQLMPLSG